MVNYSMLNVNGWKKSVHLGKLKHYVARIGQ